MVPLPLLPFTSAVLSQLSGCFPLATSSYLQGMPSTRWVAGCVAEIQGVPLASTCLPLQQCRWLLVCRPVSTEGGSSRRSVAAEHNCTKQQSSVMSHRLVIVPFLAAPPVFLLVVCCFLSSALSSFSSRQFALSSGRTAELSLLPAWLFLFLRLAFVSVWCRPL